MKILITGDRGYIGSTLVGLLLKKNHDVVGIDTDFYRHTLGTSGFPHYLQIQKDIRDIVEKDVEGMDVVIHLAALSNDPLGALNEDVTNEVNYLSSVRLAQLAKKSGVKRFIFSSSCSVYGIGTEEVVSEESMVNPLTAYAKSKFATENALRQLADSDFCVGLMRNATVYGYSSKFRDDLIVNNFTACAVATGEIRVLSDGKPWRPLIDVRDISNIFCAFIQADAQKINGNVINVGFENGNFQVKTVLEAVEKSVTGCKVIYTGEHGAGTRTYKVNFSKFASLFPHIQQEWNLEKSIKDLARHLRETNFSKDDFSAGIYSRIAQLKQLQREEKLSKEMFWEK